jgi:hypothetical protein
MTVMLAMLALAAALTALLPSERDNWQLARWLATHTPERENDPAPTGGGADRKEAA